MIFPKIKWSTAKDEWWYTITAEISIGSARYMESRCVHEMESGNATLFACVIERMQNNILDVLAEHRHNRISSVEATNNLEGCRTSEYMSSKMDDYKDGLLSSAELVAEVRAFMGLVE